MTHHCQEIALGAVGRLRRLHGRFQMTLALNERGDINQAGDDIVHLTTAGDNRLNIHDIMMRTELHILGQCPIRLDDLFQLLIGSRGQQAPEQITEQHAIGVVMQAGAQIRRCWIHVQKRTVPIKQQERNLDVIVDVLAFLDRSIQAFALHFAFLDQRDDARCRADHALVNIREFTPAGILELQDSKGIAPQANRRTEQRAQPIVGIGVDNLDDLPAALLQPLSEVLLQFRQPPAAPAHQP